MEESTPEETQGGRARRAVDGQGAFAIGVRKEKRVIEPYKYWRVDNKDKNKKRKMMAGKLWKGRIVFIFRENYEYYNSTCLW